MHFPKNLPFHGSIDSRKIGGLEWTRFSSSAISFRKTPPETARSENRHCIVITQLRGLRRYSQDEAEVILQPGDSTLIDSARPWSSDCPGECSRLYLRVPHWMMENRLRMREIPVARRIPGKAGLGATLFHLTTSLYEEAELLKPEESGAALEGYFDILSACIGHLREDWGFRHEGAELSACIQTFIEGHLAEPSLGPAAIASAAGISVRHLHRLFSYKGNTVGSWIRERRLQQCRSDLADPRLRERSITEIAFLWGFSDSAHFSRCFRRQFGVCPRVFRAQSGLKTWNDEEEQGVRDFLRTQIAELRYSKPN
jgi:AraC family transcriptional regulator, positive regulator of tynA and feaB